MHELSIAQSLVQVALEHLEAADAAGRVTAVDVRIGTLACIHPESLRLCYDAVACGTRLEGATLRIEVAPLVAFCRACQQDRTLPSIRQLVCPVCGEPTGALRSGQELELSAIELADEAPDRAPEVVAGDLCGEAP